MAARNAFLKDSQEWLSRPPLQAVRDAPPQPGVRFAVGQAVLATENAFLWEAKVRKRRRGGRSAARRSRRRLRTWPAF